MSKDDFVPPSNPGAEEAVLGSMIQDNSAIPEVRGVLTPDEFYTKANQEIYAAILGLHEGGGAVDVVTLEARLDESGRLDEIGGIEYLTRLAESVPSASNARHYAGIVRENAKRRRAMTLSQSVAKAASEGRPLTELSSIATQLRTVTEAAPSQKSRVIVGRYQPFPVDALPEPMRTFVKQASAAMGCDPTYIALPLLVALAAAIGNSRRIRLRGDWAEPSVMWAAIVGESGTLKSPALEMALKLIYERQEKAFRAYKDARAQYEIELEGYQLDLDEWKRNGRKAGKPRPEPPKKPICERIVCADTTVEALAVLLSENLRGLLVARDELSGWLASFDAYKTTRGGDAAQWAMMHGARSLTVDRKAAAKPTIYVPRAAVCVTGGIQPVILRRMLGREHFDHGLAVRLLMAMPPRKVKRWTENEVTPKAKEGLARVIDRLFALQPALDEDGQPQPVDVALTPEGKAIWAAFYDEHAAESADATGDMASAMAKLEGYAPRFALVLHLTHVAHEEPENLDSCEVDAQSMATGVALCQWFKGETERIYAALTETDEERRLRGLVEKAERKGEKGVTVRDLTRNDRFYRDNQEQAEADLDALVQAGIGRWEDATHESKGGRPTRAFKLSGVDETPAGAENTERNGGIVDNGGIDGDYEATEREAIQAEGRGAL
ncbi:MAG: DUF3987 domain-containing protein [Planctomycetota bacterium]